MLLHLESVSSVKLHMYRAHMRTIWRLARRSHYFSRFYPVATSTSMVYRSVLYGDATSMDFALDFDARNIPPANWPRYRSLPKLLKNRGYRIILLSSSPLASESCRESNDQLSVNSRSIARLLQTAADGMEDCRKKGQPFMIFFWDATSHAAFANTEKNSAEDLQKRFAAGYEQIDSSTGHIADMLTKLNLWDDTVLAAYGDHGDELWNHGFNRGYCHGTTPYGPLCHTPFFIISPDFPACIDSRIISSIDIRDTLFCHLFPEYRALKPNSRFGGRNVFHKPRVLAGSANLFPLQREYADLEKALTKGYSLTDGAYRFVVSSGGMNPEAGGMEFFLETLDPMNSRNLLDFFELDSNGEIVRFNPPPGAIAECFHGFFGEKTISEIQERFTTLKALQRKVRKMLEDHARPFVDLEKAHFFPEQAYLHSKPRAPGRLLH